MGIFQQGRDSLKKAAVEAAETILYIPHDGTPLKLQAKIGSKTFRMMQGDVSIALVHRRFIVETSSFPKRLPDTRDKIHWAGRRYDLGNPDGGAPWRHHGNTNTEISIYARDMGAIPEK